MKHYILILGPKHNLQGGVSNFYRTVKPYFPDTVKFIMKGEAKTLLGKLFSVGYFLAYFSLF